jgi:hypothetical protein
VARRLGVRGRRDLVATMAQTMCSATAVYCGSPPSRRRCICAGVDPASRPPLSAAGAPRRTTLCPPTRCDARAHRSAAQAGAAANFALVPSLPSRSAAGAPRLARARFVREAASGDPELPQRGRRVRQLYRRPARSSPPANVVGAELRAGPAQRAHTQSVSRILGREQTYARRLRQEYGLVEEAM